MALSKVNPNLITNGGSRKNIIINGGMRIDQRNGTDTINATGVTYNVDRWLGRGVSSAGVFTLTQDTNSPANFTNSLKATVTTADGSIGSGSSYRVQQMIEGNNAANLNWGTSAAQSVTLSFWVRSSVTGTFGGSVANGDYNRFNPYSYTISSANTWEYKTVTIAGDTSGTWATNSGLGIRINFSLGAGSSKIGTAGTWTSSSLEGVTGQTNLIATNSATFYLTGVQLEVGSVATDFEHRTYAESLLACQRYYEIIADGSGADDSPYFGIGHGVKSDQINWFYDFKAEKRAPITLIVNTVSNGYYAKNHSTEKNKETLGFTSGHQSLHSIMGYMTNISGVTEQSSWTMQCNGANCLIAVSAEL